MTDREILFVSAVAVGFFAVGVLAVYGYESALLLWRLRQHRRRHRRRLLR